MDFQPARVTIGSCARGTGGDGRRESTLLNHGIYSFGVNDPESKTGKSYWTQLSKATHIVPYYSAKGGYFNTDEGGNISKTLKGIYRIVGAPFQIRTANEYRIFSRNGMLFPPSHRGVDQGGEREYGSFDKDCEKIGKPSIEGGWVEYGVFVEKISNEIVDFGKLSYSTIGNIQLIKNQQQIQILSNMINNE
jgi:hypothetical protein